MSTEAHAPALPRASPHLPADEQMAPDRGAKVDDSRESGLQVPDKDHEPGTPKPLERGPLWLEDPDSEAGTQLASPSSFRMKVVKWPPRAKSEPPTDSEKKSVAQFAVRQQWKRIPEYMHRVKLVREAEAREAQAAATGSSARVYPTALDLAALSYPIPATLRARSEEVATPPQKRKRAHDDDGVDNEEHDAKRRRVGSDASPPSSTVDRPVAGNPARGGHTGATATTNHKLTTNDASRSSRTTVKLKPTLSKCPPPPRGKTVAGNAKVEKALSTVPTLGQLGRVRLTRQATPPQPLAPPRQRRKIPDSKATPAQKAAPAEAPSPQLSSSSAGEPAPSGDKAPATPRQARKIPFPKAASGVTAGGPDAPSPGPSSSSAGEPKPTPTPKGKPLGRTLLRRQPTSFFFAAPAAGGVESSVQGARADDGSMDTAASA